ncbi:hypothetical protein HKCCE3408_00815 [Rhodobacterales bacterium HKCCE3408]|nr:hypothetical protein [Rhodobacterales bacterium HKCCE3408]
MRIFSVFLAVLALTGPAAAETCRLDFTIEITQGVGDIRPGDMLPGWAEFTTQGSFRQEGGSTAHLATGQMALGEDISGPVWTLIATARNFSADLVGIYAHDVTGFSFAGVDFEGPMALTLFGPPGTRPDAVPPVTQEEWDALDLRRVFVLHAHGLDMLAGDVRELTADCQ